MQHKNKALRSYKDFKNFITQFEKDTKQDNNVYETVDNDNSEIQSVNEPLTSVEVSKTTINTQFHESQNHTNNIWKGSV